MGTRTVEIQTPSQIISYVNHQTMSGEWLFSSLWELEGFLSATRSY